MLFAEVIFEFSSSTQSKCQNLKHQVEGGWGISLGTKATQLHNILFLYFNISANLLKEKDGYAALEQRNSRSFVFKKTDKPADRSAQFFSKLQEIIDSPSHA